MIYTLSAKKIELYINTKKKTAAQIKSETGCDVLINAGLYDMKTFKPVLYLKKDGEYLSIAKDVIAELFADEYEMYDEWEKAFHEYKEKRKEAEKNFVLPKNIFFGKFRKKNDNQ